MKKIISLCFSLFFLGCNSEKTKLTLCKADIEILLDGVEAYVEKTGSAPSGRDALQELKEKGYIGGYIDPWGDLYKYDIKKIDGDVFEVSISSRRSGSRVFKLTDESL